MGTDVDVQEKVKTGYPFLADRVTVGEYFSFTPVALLHFIQSLFIRLFSSLFSISMSEHHISTSCIKMQDQIASHDSDAIETAGSKDPGQEITTLA